MEATVWGHKHRQFYRFSEVINGCGISCTGLDNCILSGLIRVHTWMYPVCVYKLTEVQHGSQILYQKEDAVVEGYAAVSADDYRRTLQQGCVAIRNFSYEDDLYCLRWGIPDVSVSMDDLVILAEEKEKIHQYLEQQGCADDVIGMLKPVKSDIGTTFDPAFRHVFFQGRDYTFGIMQAAVIRRLYEAAKTENPWMEGKQLLKEAGSASFNLKNVFSKHKYWRELIISDMRGQYRLNEDFPTEE